jgi:hypothetical protein
MKHLDDEDLILLYYGDPGAPEGARAHLSECALCRSAADSVAQTLGVCSDWTPPDPGADYARTVWAGLAPHLEEPRRMLPWTRWRIVSAAAAVVGLILAAFIAGYITRRPQPAITAALTDRARQRIFEISLADHLDRAGMLLTEISNTSYSGAVDFSPVRERAQDLVSEGRLMREMLATHGPDPTLSLLDEVERFMQEVANAPERVDTEAIRGLQARIGAGSLLFKVRVIESNLRTEGQKS